jgi:hypothetical protein
MFDKSNVLRIIDTEHKGRLLNYGHEKDELLFSGFADKEVEGD